MNFAYTILYVEHVPSSLAFYEAAFGMSRKMLHESGDYGELDTGGTTLSMASRTLMPDKGNPDVVNQGVSDCFEIAFTTAAVEAAVDKALEAGARVVQAPEVKPWGQTVAYVRDNNGFLVEICTPMS